MRAMILAPTVEQRRDVLKQMMPLQRADFLNIFRQCGGKQVRGKSGGRVMGECLFLLALLHVTPQLHSHNDRLSPHQLTPPPRIARSPFACWTPPCTSSCPTPAVALPPPALASPDPTPSTTRYAHHIRTKFMRSLSSRPISCCCTYTLSASFLVSPLILSSTIVAFSPPHFSPRLPTSPRIPSLGQGAGCASGHGRGRLPRTHPLAD